VILLAEIGLDGGIGVPGNRGPVGVGVDVGVGVSVGVLVRVMVGLAVGGISVASIIGGSIGSVGAQAAPKNVRMMRSRKNGCVFSIRISL
jgi:hypothetical protein